MGGFLLTQLNRILNEGRPDVSLGEDEGFNQISRMGKTHYTDLVRISLTLKLARMGTEAKCQGQLEEKPQRSLSTVCSRRKSFSVGGT